MSTAGAQAFIAGFEELRSESPFELLVVEGDQRANLYRDSVEHHQSQRAGYLSGRSAARSLWLLYRNYGPLLVAPPMFEWGGVDTVLETHCGVQLVLHASSLLRCHGEMSPDQLVWFFTCRWDRLGVG